MKNFVRFCLFSCVLVNTANAHVHYFNGFSVTGALGGTDAELEFSQFFDGLSAAGDDAVNPPQHKYSFASDDHIIDNDHGKLFGSNISGLVALEYAYQFNSGVVLGLALSAGFTDIEFENTLSIENHSFSRDGVPNDAVPFFNNSLVSSHLEVELENDIAVLFKPGYVFGGKTLLYALVGPRWGNFETTLTTQYKNDGSYKRVQITHIWDETVSDSESNHQYEFGVTAGAGIRYAVRDHIMLGLEYAFTHYADLDSLFNSVDPGVFFPGNESLTIVDLFMNFNASAQDMTMNTNTVMGTLSYKF